MKNTFEEDLLIENCFFFFSISQHIQVWFSVNNLAYRKT